MRQSLCICAALAMTACSPPGNDRAASVQTCGLDDDRIGQFVTVPPGAFRQGEAPVYPEEGPPVKLHVEGFEMLAHEVTNAQFRQFVDATDYVTDAERSVIEGRQGAGSAVFGIIGTDGQQGWQLVAGAGWRTPEGPGSDIAGRDKHPVVHVSLNDARAYAEWAGGRLPDETQLEYAASLALPDPGNAISAAYDEGGRPRANTWQGVFPLVDTGQDGFSGTAPVGCFGASRNGTYDLIGNVWEWTDTPYAPGQHTLKGGSFLCAENYCRRYRPSARQSQDDDFSTNHTGFRIVRDLPAK